MLCSIGLYVFSNLALHIKIGEKGIEFFSASFLAQSLTKATFQHVPLLQIQLILDKK